MTQYSPEQRRMRIKELQAELVALQQEEAAHLGIDFEALQEKCRQIKAREGAVAATKHYRSVVGCALREAIHAVEAL